MRVSVGVFLCPSTSIGSSFTDFLIRSAYPLLLCTLRPALTASGPLLPSTPTPLRLHRLSVNPALRQLLPDLSVATLRTADALPSLKLFYR
jgi:hypothetical protein